MKRGACIYILLSMIVLCSSSAVAELSVDLAPASAYETNRVEFQLNVSNFRNAYAISSLSVDLPGFSVESAVDYLGWTETFDGSIVSWSDGSLANNVILAVFEFLAEAPAVSEDTSGEATVTLVDSDSASHSFTFPLTILNDDTPPLLTDLLPTDGATVKEGTADYAVSVNATDPETGIKNVTFHWVMCNFHENITPTDHTLQLAQYQGVYQNSIDLSEYTDGNQVCFDLTAYNRGGDRSEQTGTLTIDGIPPEVTLVSPVDGAIIGLAKNFSFFSADNMAGTMNCSMDIDGEKYMQDIEAQHMDVVFIGSADVMEGEHTWSIECEDAAGWEASSVTWRYTLDKTPPSIEMTAPANGSIVPETARLVFDVTDNFALKKVWFVKDGNATEVDEAFEIDVADWPEGPNEFAVRASDSVGNQAEQTYRIIVDRTPPAPELVAPEDSSTGDVHVNFRYVVQDDYDDEMDCRVYIDDEGLEQHVAQGGAETSWAELLAIGEHRWKVQCVDDAGNTGTSDERTLTVLDLTGPDITINDPGTVTRGDPVEISLEVTDISGVGTVTAELTEPDGTTQTISLEKLGDTYTATVETTAASPTGTYTLKVYAIDTLNLSNQAESSFEVTYRYVIALDLGSATVVPGAAVVASGIVVYDNGSTVPEEKLMLQLPGNVTEEIAIGEDGGFEHGFAAPAQDGTYDVIAAVTSAENGETYTSQETLTVSTPVQATGGGGHGGGGGGSGSSQLILESSECSPDWSCTAWTMCDDGQQQKTCVDLNHCGDANEIRTRSCKIDNKEDDEDDGDREGVAVPAAREPLPEPEEHTVDTAEEDTGDTAGIGKAIGFMSSFEISPAKVLLALLLMTALLGTLYRYGWSKGDRRKTPAAVDILGGNKRKLNLEDYLDDRARRRGIY